MYAVYGLANAEGAYLTEAEAAAAGIQAAVVPPGSYVDALLLDHLVHCSLVGVRNEADGIGVRSVLGLRTGHDEGHNYQQDP